MQNRAASFLAILFALGATGTGTAATLDEGGAREIVPARDLSCQLSRATNIDPAIVQTTDQIVYEGHYRFGLHLPATPKWQGPLPEPSDDPLPVNPATKVTSDPDGLTADTTAKFDRVVDVWPDRVELIKHMAPPWGKLIIISDITPDRTAARISITNAADAATLDIHRMYLGVCKITSE